MHIFYLWMTIISCTSLWALWTFGFRPLILDRFRFEVEDLIDELEQLASTGCLTITSEIYQTERATLEGLIKVAPRFGVMQLALSRYQTSKYPSQDESAIFEQSIASLQHYAQDRLRAIRQRMALITLRFVLFRAPFFMLFAYATAFIFYITGLREKASDPVESLKREAYDSVLHHTDDHVLV